VDTTRPAGKTVANVVAELDRLERQQRSVKVREALATRKGEGVKLGRRQRVPVEVVERIARERAAGLSLPKIAEGLNRDGVKTAQGGQQWYASTVRGVLERQRD
jgi:DNA invertase Pin-like site-specific DNA recombinase